MSDPDFSPRDKTSTPKKPISPARNTIGVVALVAVVVVGGLQYWQKLGYNRAVTALDERTQNEDANMMTAQEAEGLLKKAPDGPGVDFQDGAFNYTKKTYTWSGILKSYTLTAYYTKGQDSRLVRFETEGAKLPPAPVPQVRSGPPATTSPTKSATKRPSTSTETADPKAQPPDPAKNDKPGPKPAGDAPKPAAESKSVPTPAPAKDES